MRERKHTVTIFLVLSVSIITSSVVAMLLMRHYNQVQYERLGGMLQEIIQRRPESKQTILEVLKAYEERPKLSAGKNILPVFGYGGDYFWGSAERYGLFLTGLSLITGIGLFLAAFWFCHRKEVLRIQALTSCLEKINSGGQGVFLSVSEDEFSKLQDEIYKTVTSLYQTRDAAVRTKMNFAENLSNIAHQLKTPITAISLSAQMMEEKSSLEYPAQIQKQLRRLTHLEEALLLLSRMDAGTLVLKKDAVDVFTVLTLAADNLQALFAQKGVSVEIEELGAVEIIADLDWTMEAVMNLFKNCLEHTPAGKTVHCAYEQNPLYTQIRIWDEGQGFLREDIPHLFERFYRGENAAGSGIGIGLPLAKAIIEMQNGIIDAGNIPDGGVCFEIRIYSH